MAMIRGWASQPSRRGIMPRLALRDKSLVQVAAIVVLLFAVTACAPRYSGPPFARNDTDRTGIVRVVGTNGQVDFVVPPHSSVMISVPTTIGAVTAEWLFFDDCSSGVHSFDGPIQEVPVALTPLGGGGSTSCSPFAYTPTASATSRQTRSS